MSRSLHAPLWAHVIIETYFENFPHEETMELYKSQGLLCSQYWYRELRRILTAKWHLTDPSFQALRPDVDYLLEAYADTVILDVRFMKKEDQKALLKAFCNALGMHTDIFPFRVEDILTQ